MKKKLIGIMCGALALAVAVPAMADHKIGGYFRTQAYVQQPLGKDVKNDLFVAQRIRMMWTNTLNDYVAVVWYGEVNNIFGRANGLSSTIAGDKVGRYSGGGAATDGVNVQTKHAYATLKIPGDMGAMVRVGLQGVGDSIQNVYINEDVAGVTTGAKFGPVAVDLGWAKFTEGAVNAQDDQDLYFASVGAAPMENVKVGGELFIWHDMAAQDTVYTFDLNGAASFGIVSVDGFLAFQVGTLADGMGAAEQDHSAFAASANVSAKLAMATLGARIIYFGEDDDKNDSMAWMHGAGAFEFAGEGLHIMLPSIYNTGFVNDRVAMTSAALSGYGLLGLVLRADASFDMIFAKARLGYFTALDDSVNGAAKSKHGESLGIELAGEVGAKVLDGAAVVALRGSYVVVDEFFDMANGTGGWNSPDDMYMACLMLNIPY